MDISPEYQDILKGIKEAKILTPGEKKALAKQRAELSPNLAADLKEIRKLWQQGCISADEYYPREIYLRLMLARQYAFERWQKMVNDSLNKYYGE